MDTEPRQSITSFDTTRDFQFAPGEYFVRAYSNAAPFVSDESFHYITLPDDGREWFDVFQESYKHPCGLFSAAVYLNADHYHRDRNQPLGVWLSESARRQQEERRRAGF